VTIAAGGYQSIAVIGAGLAGPTFRTTNFNRAGGVCSIQVPTIRGKTYYFQHRDSLTSPWISSLPVPGDGSTKTFSDPSPLTPQRFYRVWQKP
jgi:hypothetical protein